VPKTKRPKRKRAAPKRRKARKPAAAPKRKRAPKHGPKRAPKRRTTRLHVELTIPSEMRLDGPELSQLSAAQRLELAGMGTRKRTSSRPAWASDERGWRKAMRLVSSSWRRYTHPYAAVALVYLRSGGEVRAHNATGRQLAHDLASPTRRRPRGLAGGGGVALEVERVDLDALGYDDMGRYYGVGEPLWRVSSSPGSPVQVDTVVRARTAGAARSQVAEQFAH
jgi:hypothetical protein